jgi:hypothetical protein
MSSNLTIIDLTVAEARNFKPGAGWIAQLDDQQRAHYVLKFEAALEYVEQEREEKRKEARTDGDVCHLERQVLVSARYHRLVYLNKQCSDLLTALKALGRKRVWQDAVPGTTHKGEQGLAYRQQGDLRAPKLSSGLNAWIPERN